jgi:uncharacterized protein (DUF1499 family)/uncharacterized membrane protein
LAALIERRATRWASLSRWLGSFSLVLLITACLAHRYQYLETPPFLWVLAIDSVLAILALLCGLLAFRRYWVHDDFGSADLTVGIVLALLTLSPFAVSAYRYFTLPQLVDIATDVKDPPSLADAAARTGGQNPIAITAAEGEAQARAYPAVIGHHYDMPIEQVMEVVETVAANRGWALTSSTEQGDSGETFTLEGPARSLILGLPADISIRVTESGDGSEVDMRSASRFGPHDLGDNAQRIEGFLSELDVEVARRTAAITPSQ